MGLLASRAFLASLDLKENLVTPEALDLKVKWDNLVFPDFLVSKVNLEALDCLVKLDCLDRRALPIVTDSLL